MKSKPKSVAFNRNTKIKGIIYINTLSKKEKPKSNFIKIGGIQIY